MGLLRDIADQNASIRSAEKRNATPKPSGGKLSGVSHYLTAPKVAQPTYEYAVVVYQNDWRALDSVRKELDQMGAHGWELVERRDEGTGMTRREGFFTLFFKRRTS